jgi:hypothetical protein
MPWGVEVKGDVSQVTLNDLPQGDLWVRVTANESDECGGPTSDAFKVTTAAGPQVLGATGISENILLTLLGFVLISLGLWQIPQVLSARARKTGR